MHSQQSLMVEMSAPHQAKRTTLDYQERAGYTARPAVKLAVTFTANRQSRVQISTRRSGSLERCWAALPIVLAGARSVKPAGASVLANGLTKLRADSPVRFG